MKLHNLLLGLGFALIVVSIGWMFSSLTHKTIEAVVLFGVSGLFNLVMASLNFVLYFSQKRL